MKMECSNCKKEISFNNEDCEVKCLFCDSLIMTEKGKRYFSYFIISISILVVSVLFIFAPEKNIGEDINIPTTPIVLAGATVLFLCIGMLISIFNKK